MNLLLVAAGSAASLALVLMVTSRASSTAALLRYALGTTLGVLSLVYTLAAPLLDLSAPQPVLFSLALGVMVWALYPAERA